MTADYENETKHLRAIVDAAAQLFDSFDDNSVMNYRKLMTYIKASEKYTEFLKRERTEG